MLVSKLALPDPVWLWMAQLLPARMLGMLMACTGDGAPKPCLDSATCVCTGGDGQARETFKPEPQLRSFAMLLELLPHLQPCAVDAEGCPGV